MKKLFIAALLAIGLSTTAFAIDENKVSVRILTNFQEEFKGIDDVDWTVRDDFAKASFTQNGEKMEVFYDLEGNKLGSSHHVALNDLPVNARRTIAKKYAGYDVVESVVFNGVTEDAYYVSAENAEEKLILKISKEGLMTTFKKTRKDKFW